MINTIKHNINIDLANKINMNQSINIKKNDTNSHKFAVNIFNNSLSYNLTGSTAKIYFQKADKEIVFADCTIENALEGKISYILKTQETSYVGLVLTEITIYGSAGEILTSVTFNFTVAENIRDDGAIQSTSEFTALTDALAVVTTISNKLDKTEFNTFKDSTVTQLADIATNPDSFQGTDFQKLQQAIDYAIPLKKGIRLDRMYDITGQGTLMLSVKYGMARGYSRFFSANNGGILKNDTGIIFSATNKDTTDFNFSHLRFEASHSVQVTVFDCSKLIGITTEVCTFVGIHTIFYADNTGYLQTIRMIGDLVQDMYGCVVDTPGAFNVNLKFDMEIGYASVINQRKVATTFNYLAGVTVTCLAEAQKNINKPIFNLCDCRGVTIQNGHFEVNDGGDIVLDASGSFRQLAIKNNHFYSPAKHPVKWGGALTSCYSEGNINLGEKGMHDTTNVTLGNVISNTDYTPVAYPNTDPASRIKYQENFQSAKTFNVMTQTQQVATDGYISKQWGDITRQTSTVLNTAFTAGETKHVAFVFQNVVNSDDIISIWNWGKDGSNNLENRKLSVGVPCTSVDKLTLYYPITNNEAIPITIFKLRATVVKTMPSVQG